MRFRILFIALLLFATIAYTQNFNGGLIGGFTASQTNDPDVDDYNKLGFDIGGFVNLKTGRFTTLEMEMKYIQKGSKSTFDPFADTTASTRSIYRLQLNYIELPVVLKYNLKGLSRHRSDTSRGFINKLSVEIGLAYAELLSSSEEQIPVGVFIIYSPPFKHYDFSGIGGIYYQLTKNLEINIRKSSSLLPVRSYSGGATYRLNLGEYNDVFELTLHYQFPNKNNNIKPE